MATIYDAFQQHGSEVFISYSRKDDKRLAKQIQDALVARGLGCFRDEASIVAGDNFKQRIEDALTRCGLMVVIETPNAANSDWVPYEVITARSRKPEIRVIPVVAREPKQERTPYPLERVFLLQDGQRVEVSPLPGHVQRLNLSEIGVQRAVDEIARIAVQELRLPLVREAIELGGKATTAYKQTVKWGLILSAVLILILGVIAVGTFLLGVGAQVVGVAASTRQANVQQAFIKRQEARAQVEQGELGNAVSLCDAAVAFDDTSPRSRCLRGEVLLALSAKNPTSHRRELEGAAQDFMKAASLWREPDSDAVVLDLAMPPEMQELLREEEGNVPPELGLGVARALAGDRAGAIAAFAPVVAGTGAPQLTQRGADRCAAAFVSQLSADRDVREQLEACRDLAPGLAAWSETYLVALGAGEATRSTP